MRTVPTIVDHFVWSEGINWNSRSMVYGSYNWNLSLYSAVQRHLRRHTERWICTSGVRLWGCCRESVLLLWWISIFGLLGHNPLEVSDVLVHFLFWQSYTICPKEKLILKKSQILVFNDLCSHNEKEKERQQSRGGVCVVVRLSYQTQLFIYFFFFLNDSFCNPW